MKQTILATTLAFSLVAASAFADTCPSVKAIKSDKIAGWKIVDSDDGKPLNARRSKEFKQNIVEFLLAEWKGKEHNGAIHCYYRDGDGANMEAYLTKSKLDLNNSKHYWYRVSGFMHCAASDDSCEFEKAPLKGKRLAKK